MSARSTARPLATLAAVSLLALAACTGTASTEPGASTVALVPSALTVPSAAPASAAEPSVAPPASAPAGASAEPASSDDGLNGPSAVPTALDPCQMVTKDQAGQLAGATFGDGKEEETSGHAKICTYGAQTKNVFQVYVAQAPDAKTAKAEEAAILNEFANSGGSGAKPKLTQLPGLATGTDCELLVVPTNALKINGTAIYCLHDATFYGLSDLTLGTPGISEADAQTTATQISATLP